MIGIFGRLEKLPTFAPAFTAKFIEGMTDRKDLINNQHKLFVI